MINELNKVVRLGSIKEGNHNADVYCKITYVKDKERLSITGVVGPKVNGNCWGSCGQINMSLNVDDMQDYAHGWHKAKIRKFMELWDKWHLNDMQAGSPKQTAYLDNLGEYKDYSWACEQLEQAGLLFDKSYLYNGKPYRYGSAWLTTELPQDVINWLANLPETDKEPAWI